MLARILVLLITSYQKTISPDHGIFRGRFPYGYCRFYPSCSEYTRRSILERGVLRGLKRGFVRVLKCNPFTPPQIDPPN